MKWNKVVDSIKLVAPTVVKGLATITGGPIAGMAVGALADAIFDAPQTGVSHKNLKKKITEAVLSGDPAVFEKIKTAELAFKQKLLDADIKITELENADRHSARQREMTLRDKTPAILAGVTITGFFGILIALCVIDNIPETSMAPLQIMLGALGAAFTGIISYYFGSSKGSSDKTKLLAGME